MQHGVGLWRNSLGSIAFACALTCCTYPPPPLYTPTTQGKLVSKGGLLGDFEFVPKACSTSKHGVDIVMAANGAAQVRLNYSYQLPDSITKEELLALTQQSPKQRLVLRVASFVPKEPVEVALMPSQCELLTGYAHNESGYAAVSVRCATPQGGHLDGYLIVTGCGS